MISLSDLFSNDVSVIEQIRNRFNPSTIVDIINKKLDVTSALQMYDYILDESAKFHQNQYAAFRDQLQRLHKLQDTVKERIFFQQEVSLTKYISILDKEDKKLAHLISGYTWFRDSVTNLMQAIHDHLDYHRLGLVAEQEKSTRLEKFSGMLRSVVEEKKPKTLASRVVRVLEKVRSLRG